MTEEMKVCPLMSAPAVSGGSAAPVFVRCIGSDCNFFETQTNPGMCSMLALVNYAILIEDELTPG